MFENEKPVLISPLYKKKHELFVAGGSIGWDYTDFFYSFDCNDENLSLYIDYLFSFLREEGFLKLHWDFCAADSVSTKLLKKHSKVQICEVNNVGIKFDNYNDYVGSLSKSVRQNLRTAVNRLNREHKTYELLNNINSPLSNEIVKQCIDLYCARQKNKYMKNILNLIMIKTINFQSQMMYQQKGIFFVLTIDSKVASFMFGYQCENSLEIPKLAINDTFGFYSPGMLLVNKTIEFLANETEIRYLDLCRGTEPYKLKMGGGIYKTYNYLIEL